MTDTINARPFRRVLVLMTCALLLSAHVGLAQGQGRGQGRGSGWGSARGAGPVLLRDTLPVQGPIELLLARRDSLALTSTQVAQLKQLDAELQDQNAPYVRSMIELRREVQPLIGMHPRDMTPAQRAQFQKQAQRAHPLMQQIHENNRHAMERVSTLLTAAQKRWVRVWLDPTL